MTQEDVQKVLKELYVEQNDYINVLEDFCMEKISRMRRNREEMKNYCKSSLSLPTSSGGVKRKVNEVLKTSDESFNDFPEQTRRETRGATKKARYNMLKSLDIVPPKCSANGYSTDITKFKDPVVVLTPLKLRETYFIKDFCVQQEFTDCVNVPKFSNANKTLLEDSSFRQCLNTTVVLDNSEIPVVHLMSNAYGLTNSSPDIVQVNRQKNIRSSRNVPDSSVVTMKDIVDSSTLSSAVLHEEYTNAVLLSTPKAKPRVSVKKNVFTLEILEMATKADITENASVRTTRLTRTMSRARAESHIASKLEENVGRQDGHENNAKNLGPSKHDNIIMHIETLTNKGQVNPNQEKTEENKRDVDAVHKKVELLQEKVERQKRMREKKMQKVLETRGALEREKQEQNHRLCEEKDKKMKQFLHEQEAKLKEENIKKKQQTQKKIAAAEERRRIEEAARLAKLKEKEEELQRLQVARKKEQEEAERQQEALRMKEMTKAQTRVQEVQVGEMKMPQLKLKAIKGFPTSYSITPTRDELPPAPPKTSTDYGIDDVNSDDSSDSEYRPKKIIPLWARKSIRLLRVKLQEYIPYGDQTDFMSCQDQSPDLIKMFKTIDKKHLVRTSSAVWRTPPRYNEV